jgi:hypothetical protein
MKFLLEIVTIVVAVPGKAKERENPERLHD